MVKITGIGAIIINANDPRTLAEWYNRILGIRTYYNVEDGYYYGSIGEAESEENVQFGIYQAKEQLPAGRAIMINYEVNDFDAFAEALRARGIEMRDIIKVEYGRFGYLDDPEGNPIEIYAPPGDRADE
jgi:predicted enzyme related to lactoylglutathione lyase